MSTIEINVKAKQAEPWGKPLTAEEVVANFKAGLLMGFFKDMGGVYKQTDWVLPTWKTPTLEEVTGWINNPDSPRVMRSHTKLRVAVYKPIIKKSGLIGPMFMVLVGPNRAAIDQMIQDYDGLGLLEDKLVGNSMTWAKVPMDTWKSSIGIQ
jgi:hypothetical protein